MNTRLEEIKATLAAATGPWEAIAGGYNLTTLVVCNGVTLFQVPGYPSPIARLAANAPENMAWLIEQLEKRDELYNVINNALGSAMRDLMDDAIRDIDAALSAYGGKK